MEAIDADLVAAFRDYAEARVRFLNALERATSCRDPLAELSEWLVHRLLGGTLALSRVQKGYDLIRPDGRKVQVKYLANPGQKWVNEHHVRFDGGADDYALVVFEGMALDTVVLFARETIGEVCRRLGKRHPGQDRGLQMTRVNYLEILDNAVEFARIGVSVYRP
jgi:hypothetical protein